MVIGTDVMYPWSLSASVLFFDSPMDHGTYIRAVTSVLGSRSGRFESTFKTLDWERYEYGYV